METLLYLAKVNAYWLLFYTCYWFLLRKHTFFHWNRFYLLGTLLIAFALPAIHFAEPITIIHVPETVYQKATISVAVVAGNAPTASLNAWWWVAGLYMVVVLCLIWTFSSGLLQLFKAAQQSEKIDMEHYTLLLLPENVGKTSQSSFSFFCWLFLSDHDYRHNPDVVIRHECEHIRQWHTLDILIAELVKIIFWFNPVLWLYKRSIQTVHEYLADLPVPNRNDYASFLVAYAMRSPDIAIANHFFNSSILKKRIQMIYKKRSSRWLRTKYLLILPVVICSLTISASHAPLQMTIGQISAPTREGTSINGQIADENDGPIPDATIVVAGTTRGTTTDKNGRFELKNLPEGAKLVITHVAYEPYELTLTDTQTNFLLILKKRVNEIKGAVVVGKPALAESATLPSSTVPNENSDMKVVERLPEFPGGRDALMQYLLQNLEYPETARKINVEAIALVSFVVDKNGDIRNAKSLKNIGHGIDKEALRVVNKMPKWNPAVQNGKPVEMEYTLEVNFKMEKSEQDRRQGFLNFNTKGIFSTPTIDEIGSFLNGTLNLSKSGRVPDVAYGSSYSAIPRVPSMSETSPNDKYRYLNYSDADLKIRKMAWKYQKAD